jgi:RHS repeat-associated protein
MVGKTSGADVWAYDWDAENRLILVRKNGAVVVSYTYDPLGRRATRSTSFWPGGPQNTVVQTYLHDGEDVLREGFALLFHARGADYDAHVYTHGPGIDEPLEVEHGTGEIWYYHADALGSIVRMTDGEQNVIEEMSRQYDAFGQPELGAGEAGYAYTGREWDPEAGLYYYRARYYDPVVSRFLSSDPIGFVGGFNFYAYVGNRPTALTDPSGLRIRVTLNEGPAEYDKTTTCTNTPGATCHQLLPGWQLGPCRRRSCGFGFEVRIRVKIWQEFSLSQSAASAATSADQPWLSLQHHEDLHMADMGTLFSEQALNSRVQTEGFPTKPACDTARSGCIGRIVATLQELANLSGTLRGDQLSGGW